MRAPHYKSVRKAGALTIKYLQGFPVARCAFLCFSLPELFLAKVYPFIDAAWSIRIALSLEFSGLRCYQAAWQASHRYYGVEQLHFFPGRPTDRRDENHQQRVLREVLSLLGTKSTTPTPCKMHAMTLTQDRPKM